jgi:ankyrin repeat protein
MFDEDLLKGWILPHLPGMKTRVINMPCKSIYAVHDQWPVQLTGTPLAFSISVGSLTNVERLLRLGAEPLGLIYAASEDEADNQRHQSQWTAVHLATKYHRDDMLSALFDTDSRCRRQHQIPYACALSFSTSLERRGMHGMEYKAALRRTIRRLLEGDPSALRAHSPDGMTPLMQAIDFHDIDVVEALLEIEPSLASNPLRDPRNEHVFTLPIHFAAQLAARRDVEDATKILEIITQHSDHLNPKQKPPRDNAGRTPLHLSVTGPSSRATKWLLDMRPGLLMIEDKQGRPPLHCCASPANSDMLLLRGAKVDHADTYGMTALHRACYIGDAALVISLLKHKPNLGLRNNAFGTPLHCATHHGSSECCLALLEAGADVNKADRSDNTPVHVAAAQSRHSILRLLMKHGANIGARNKARLTAEDIAGQLGTVESVGTRHILRGGLHVGQARILYSDYSEWGFQSQAVPIRAPRQFVPVDMGGLAGPSWPVAGDGDFAESISDGVETREPSIFSATSSVTMSSSTTVTSPDSNVSVPTPAADEPLSLREMGILQSVKNRMMAQLVTDVQADLHSSRGEAQSEVYRVQSVFANAESHGDDPMSALVCATLGLADGRFEGGEGSRAVVRIARALRPAWLPEIPDAFLAESIRAQISADFGGEAGGGSVDAGSSSQSLHWPGLPSWASTGGGGEQRSYKKPEPKKEASRTSRLSRLFSKGKGHDGR